MLQEKAIECWSIFKFSAVLKWSDKKYDILFLTATIDAVKLTFAYLTTTLEKEVLFSALNKGIKKEHPREIFMLYLDWPKESWLKTKLDSFGDETFWSRLTLWGHYTEGAKFQPLVYIYYWFYFMYVIDYNSQ